MDWRNDEADDYNAENIAWDEKNFLYQTMSDVCLSGTLGCSVHSQGVQVNVENCKESRSLTSTLERLELEAEVEYKNEVIPLHRTSDAQTEPFDDTDQELFDLNTKDVLPYRRSVHHTDILNYQGVMHPPEDIARYWKKDSRMWLWKSVRLMRKRNKFKSSTNICTANKEVDEEE